MEYLLAPVLYYAAHLFIIGVCVFFRLFYRPMPSSRWYRWALVAILLSMAGCQPSFRSSAQLTCSKLQTEFSSAPPTTSVQGYIVQAQGWVDSLQSAHREAHFIGSSPSEFQPQALKCLLARHPGIAKVEINQPRSSLLYQLKGSKEWRNVLLEGSTSLAR